jgi:hypothetical protein
MYRGTKFKFQASLVIPHYWSGVLEYPIHSLTMWQSVIFHPPPNAWSKQNLFKAEDRESFQVFLLPII